MYHQTYEELLSRQSVGDHRLYDLHGEPVCLVGPEALQRRCLEFGTYREHAHQSDRTGDLSVLPDELCIDDPDDPFAREVFPLGSVFLEESLRELKEDGQLSVLITTLVVMLLFVALVFTLFFAIRG